MNRLYLKLAVRKRKPHITPNPYLTVSRCTRAFYSKQGRAEGMQNDSRQLHTYSSLLVLFHSLPSVDQTPRTIIYTYLLSIQIGERESRGRRGGSTGSQPEEVWRSSLSLKEEILTLKFHFSLLVIVWDPVSSDWDKSVSLLFTFTKSLSVLYFSRIGEGLDQALPCLTELILTNNSLVELVSWSEDWVCGRD